MGGMVCFAALAMTVDVRFIVDGRDGLLLPLRGIAMTVDVRLIQVGSYGLLRHFAPRNDGGWKVISGWELWFASLRSQ
jgi:hypothetical protein